MVDSAAVAGWVREDFGVELASVHPVAGGADDAALVWRALTVDGAALAVKWSGTGLAAGAAVAAHLAACGVAGVPAPLPSVGGRPWSVRGGGQVSVTPWIAGRRGADAAMGAHEWRTFGVLLARLHATEVPGPVAAMVPREDHRPAVAALTRRLDARIQALRAGAGLAGLDALSRGLVGAWLDAAGAVAALVERAEALGRDLRRRPVRPVAVLCHADAHTLNVVVAGSGQVWLVDWDSVMVAPRERDLMFVVDGVLGDSPVTARERSWFFGGYGPARVDVTRLGYYRCVRALEDLTGFAARVLDPGGWPRRERAAALGIVGGLLHPTGIIALALSTPDR